MTSAIGPNESISIVRGTTTGRSQHSRVKPLAGDAQIGVAKDLQGFCVGPMPYKGFLDTLMPNRGPAFEVGADVFYGIKNDEPEIDRYKPFVSPSSLLDCTRRDRSFCIDRCHEEM